MTILHPMVTCVWRASGPKFDVNAFLAIHSEIDPDNVWHDGERQLPHREPFDSSGFNELVAEARTGHEVVEILRAKLSFPLQVNDARETGAMSELDFGIQISASTPMVELSFEPADFQYLAQLVVSVTVSAYLCAEEDVHSKDGAI